VSEIEDLKRLLFGAEKQTLESLSDRVERPEMRSADVADVIPEALRLSYSKDEDALVRELRAPVAHCLTESFQESPQQYADVLYPIMGPAIRKSISHALRAFAQQINETMEHSLSAKVLHWRWQAMRAGIPFGEFVIQQTLEYRVEQVYLISRGNGLLIEHVHHDAARIKDSDAVSAMFTAIQDFVKESFSPDPNSRLETADMGEFTLWAVHGPHALLVSVIRGVPPASLRADLSAILERMHFRYGDALRNYVGDTASTRGIDVELTEAIQLQAKQKENESKKKTWLPFAILFLVAMLIFGYLGYKRWETQKQIAFLTENIEGQPGIYLDDISHSDDIFVLSGLRDPLADEIEKIVEESGFDSRLVVANFQPYRALDPEIVYRRAIANIGLPEGVSVSVNEGTLILTGAASQKWIDTVMVKSQAASIGMPIDFVGLESIEVRDIETASAELEGSEFRFVSDDNLEEGELARVDVFVERLDRLIESAATIGRSVDVRIRGYTDNAGSIASNTALSIDRARAIQKLFVDRGIPLNSVNIEAPSAFDFVSADSRSAEVLVRIGE